MGRVALSQSFMALLQATQGVSEGFNGGDNVWLIDVTKAIADWRMYIAMISLLQSFAIILVCLRTDMHWV